MVSSRKKCLNLRSVLPMSASNSEGYDWNPRGMRPGLLRQENFGYNVGFHGRIWLVCTPPMLEEGYSRIRFFCQSYVSWQASSLTFVYFGRHCRGSVLFERLTRQSLGNLKEVGLSRWNECFDGNEVEVTLKSYFMPGGMQTFWSASKGRLFIF